MKLNRKQKIIAVSLVGLLLFAAVASGANTQTDEYSMFKFYIDYIIDKWEGTVYEDHPTDKGGPTKFGIDQRSHPSINIRNLTRAQAIDIYFNEYWKPAKLNLIPHHIQFMQFGGTINFGITGQIKVLQDAANVAQDGQLGSQTLAAANNVTPKMLFLAQKARYDRIVANDSSQQTFYRGWINRINDIYQQQLQINQYS